MELQYETVQKQKAPTNERLLFSFSHLYYWLPCPYEETSHRKILQPSCQRHRITTTTTMFRRYQQIRESQRCIRSLM